jgi:hypothetical protein
MNAFSGPYSVLVLDNVSIHKGQHLLDICNAKGVRIEFLPPYSPDLSIYNNFKLNLNLILFVLKCFLLIDRTIIFLHKKLSASKSNLD